MENEKLIELLDKMNDIYTYQSYDIVQECMDILGIRVSEFEKNEAEFNASYNIDYKDIYAKKIVEEVEKRLTDDQKVIFYNGLSKGLIKYTSNDLLKKQFISEIIDNEMMFDYDGIVEGFYLKTMYPIKDDSFKIDFIEKYKDKMHFFDLRLMVESLDDDQNKLKYLPVFLENDLYDDLFYILMSFKDDYLKLSLYEKYKDEFSSGLNYSNFLCSLHRDDLKLTELEKKEYSSRLTITKKLIYSLSYESTLKIWDKIGDENKTIIIYKANDLDQKMELLKKLNDDLKDSSDKTPFALEDLINDLPQENISYILTECPNINIGRVGLIEILKNLSKDEDKLKILKLRGYKSISKYVRNNRLIFPENMLQNLDLFLKLEGVSDIDKVREYVEYLFKTNNDIIYEIDWNILKPKYVETLGLDKINVFGSFNSLVSCILEMNDKEYEAFTHALDYYIQTEGEITWQNAAYQMIAEIHFNKIDHKEICDYIDDINNVNIKNLTYILFNGDDFGIKSLSDINNYDTLLKEKNDKKIIEGSISEKKDAIFFKYFGLSDYFNLMRGFRKQIKNGIGRIYNLYSKNIDLIENNEIKELFNFIKMVFECESEEELINIYNSKSDFGHLDTYKLERVLKNELLKLYNKELFKLDNLEKNSEGLYEAGVDFSMITTSVGAYVKNSPDNYMNDWNRPSLASGHFCSSYIRNDMLGTAPVPHIMYGFASMEPYSLLLSGSTDIYSSGASFISKAYHGERYLGPDSQINETAYNEKFKYNEMDFSRIQNGVKKNPDYIVVLRRDGVIDNIDEARKASDDWGGMPIVVVDVDLCLKHERELVEEMLTEYSINPSIELFNKIKTKIMNNRVTDSSFLDYINLDELNTINDQNIEKNSTQSM